MNSTIPAPMKRAPKNMSNSTPLASGASIARIPMTTIATPVASNASLAAKVPSFSMS